MLAIGACTQTNTPTPIRRLIEPRLPSFGVQELGRAEDILFFQEIEQKGWAGLTRYSKGSDTECYVIAEYDDRVEGFTVVAHELLHAIGFRGHFGRPGTYLSMTPRMDAGEPCDEIKGWLLRAKGQYRVWVQDREINREVIWATSMWNHFAGRDLFLVHRAP